MKTFKHFTLKTLILGLMVLFAAGAGFSEANEVFNEIGVNAITRDPVENGEVVFGGVYNDTGVKLDLERFWVDARVRMDLFSLNEWETAEINLINNKTHINAGFRPFKSMDFTLGTDYDSILPGGYMYAYNDVIPNARYGNTGFTYEYTGLKSLLGLTMAMNIPLQNKMFSNDNVIEMNGAVCYESPIGINLGTRFYGNWIDDFSMAAFVSGGANSRISWVAGYTYKGKSVDGLTPADHYIDTSTNFALGFIDISTDFEIGFKGINNASPMYNGIQVALNIFDSIIPKMTVMYNVSDAKNFDSSVRTMVLHPRLLLEKDNYRISVGTELLFVETATSDMEVGFSVPIYLKYWF